MTINIFLEDHYIIKIELLFPINLNLPKVWIINYLVKRVFWLESTLISLLLGIAHQSLFLSPKQYYYTVKRICNLNKLSVRNILLKIIQTLILFLVSLKKGIDQWTGKVLILSSIQLQFLRKRKSLTVFLHPILIIKTIIVSI